MNLSDFSNLRPTHIEQKLNKTNILLLPLSVIYKLQTFKIPILKSYNIDELEGWFWSSKLNSIITGISFIVTNDESRDKSEKVLKKLISFLEKNRINIPFFIEAEIDLKLLDKNPETVFYHLLQSYFTTFNLKIDITNFKNEIEQLNQIYKSIRDLELGFTLTITSNKEDCLKYIDEFTRALSVFKINPNYIKFENNDYELKTIMKERLEIKLSEDIELFNNFSSNIYINGDFFKSDINENTENQIFYSSRKLFNTLKIKNTISKLLNNLYNLGDEL